MAIRDWEEYLSNKLSFPFIAKRIDDADNVVWDGLIEPIIVRPQKKGRFQLIAGERRFRAIKDYTDMTIIQAKIAIVDDLLARKIKCYRKPFKI
jgi:hypothetical protein